MSGSSSEHCFTTEGIFDPLAVAAARTRASATSSGYKFSRVNGIQPACFMCSLLNSNSNADNNTSSTSTAAPAIPAVVTPDPWTSMEIGNWRESGSGTEGLKAALLGILLILIKEII